MPAPGEAVVSPALDRAASRYPALAARYPKRILLGDAGIGGADELFAYVRVPEGRTLIGEDSAIRAHSFGPQIGSAPSIPLGEYQVVRIDQVALGVLALLVFPGLLVLAVGVAAASVVRDHRFGVLRSLGAPGRTLSALAALETLLLASPGILAAVFAWSVVAPRIERVPLVGHGVVRGDMGLPLPQLLALIIASAAATALLAALTAAVRELRTVSPRPSGGRVAISSVRAAPLAVAVAILIFTHERSGAFMQTLRDAGLALAVAGAPLLLPAVLRLVGARLAALAPVPALLAGRGMAWDPVRLARPFLPAAAVVVLAVVGSGYIAFLRSRSHSRPSPAASRGWPSHMSNGLTLARTTLPSLRRRWDLGWSRRSNRTARWSYSGRPAPSSPSIYRVPSAPPRSHTRCRLRRRPRLRELLLPFTYGSEVRLTPPGELASVGTALVIARATDEVIDQRTRVAAARALPAPYVTSTLDSVFRVRSHLDGWIIGGLVAGLAGLAVGGLFAMVDRLISTSRRRRHLLSLGIGPGRLAVLEVYLFVVPYVATVVYSFTVGFALCWYLIETTNTALPWNALGATLAVALLTGFIGAACVALFGVRSIGEDHRQ
ncbi:MAG: hypothetical protein WKH64_04120 [Chloroflexia bacterium]